MSRIYLSVPSLSSWFKQKGRREAVVGHKTAPAQDLPAKALNFGVRYSAQLSREASCM